MNMKHHRPRRETMGGADDILPTASATTQDTTTLLAPLDDCQHRAFTFDLSRCTVIDAEVYANRWCVGFQGLSRDGSLGVRIVDGDRAELTRALADLFESDRILVGYNSTKFDIPLILHILEGFDAYAVSQRLIRGDCVRLPKNSLFSRLSHIDLSSRVRRGGRFPSLKAVAANLGRPVLRELPYPPDASLTDEEWEDAK
jgi:hypothetical protein